MFIKSSKRGDPTLTPHVVFHHLLLQLKKQDWLVTGFSYLNRQDYYRAVNTARCQFKNFVFAQNGLPNFAPGSLDYLEQKFGTTKTQTIVNMYQELARTYVGPYKITTVPCRSVWTLQPMPMVRSNPNTEQYHRVLLLYTNLIYLSPGEHLTLISNPRIQSLGHAGYNLECFGSSFNARLKYFGSLSPLDEPFGRVGSYDEILRTLADGKDLCWRNEIVIGARDPVRITVNPPSGNEILYNAVELVLALLQARPNVECILQLPKRFYGTCGKNLKPFIVASQVFDTGISLYDNKTANLKGSPWIEFTLSNQKV